MLYAIEVQRPIARARAATQTVSSAQTVTLRPARVKTLNIITTPQTVSLIRSRAAPRSLSFASAQSILLSKTKLTGRMINIAASSLLSLSKAARRLLGILQAQIVTLVSGKVRLSQQYVEVINSGDPALTKVRVSQQYLEVISDP